MFEVIICSICNVSGSSWVLFYLEGTRDKVIANAAVRAEVQKYVGEKDAIQDQVKLIGVDLDGARKDQQEIKAKVKSLEAEKEAINGVITSLEEELHMVALVALIEKEKDNKKPNGTVKGKNEKVVVEEEEQVFGLEKKPVKAEVIDESKLKEMEREEEIMKAKQTLERKKKLVEKAAFKAKKKADKEAEKKLTVANWLSPG